LFYKFYLDGSPEAQRSGVKGEELQSEHLSASEIFHPETPCSAQIYQRCPEGRSLEDVLGRPMMHLSALQQATGEALYCDDVPLYENELFLALITSTKAHAKHHTPLQPRRCQVLSAVCSPLIFRAVTRRDRSITTRTVLADQQVTCVGHIIGAVVAETQLEAQRAAKAVKVQYEELKAVITIQEAIAKQSFYQPIRTIQNGDLEAGFKQADHILEGRD
ncbi:hypothetical protein KUCAC02_035989, partial [Chaenocephalus aceratus]